MTATSAVRPKKVWKALAAASVCGPKTPSAARVGTIGNTLLILFKNLCMVRTFSPREPTRRAVPGYGGLLVGGGSTGGGVTGGGVTGGGSTGGDGGVPFSMLYCSMMLYHVSWPMIPSGFRLKSRWNSRTAFWVAGP